VEYPLGHRRRRAEGIPLLIAKARENLSTGLPADRVEELISLCQNRERLSAMPVHQFMDLMAVPEYRPAQALANVWGQPAQQRP
jgi:2-methylcitrate dehydratase